MAFRQNLWIRFVTGSAYNDVRILGMNSNTDHRSLSSEIQINKPTHMQQFYCCFFFVLNHFARYLV